MITNTFGIKLQIRYRKIYLTLPIIGERDLRGGRPERFIVSTSECADSFINVYLLESSIRPGKLDKVRDTHCWESIKFIETMRYDCTEHKSLEIIRRIL